MQKKGYTEPSYQGTFVVKKSLDAVKKKISSLRNFGYRINANQNVYNDNVFNIAGFGAANYELEAVLQETEEGLELRYNSTVSHLKMSNFARFSIAIVLLVIVAIVLGIYTSGIIDELNGYCYDTQGTNDTVLEPAPYTSARRQVIPGFPPMHICGETIPHEIIITTVIAITGLLLIAILTVLFKNPYERENREARTALALLEKRFIAAINS
jgi:hypothetical protein